ARGESVPWRRELLYEYYWERNFPQTPTVHALRTRRYKFVRVHGLWDIDELYDLDEDPIESRNLIFDPAHRRTAEELRARLWRVLEQTAGMYIPLQPDAGPQMNLRHPDRSKAADFPEQLRPRLKRAEPVHR
ncbi:MAG: sulfatase/phosphatase domain-containing protein, partial [Bryobacteraceae bacterium]